MKRFLDTLRSAISWFWRFAGAGIAVLLIVGALILGYRIGRPGADHAVESSTGEQSLVSDEQQMYTCSMHPAVRLPDPDAKCPICFMDLIPVPKSSGAESGERQIAFTDAASTTSRVETATVGRFFPTATVRLYGKVTYDETTVARLTAYFPGRIERLFVNYLGASVSKGDHIAEMYSPDLLAAFAELQQARRAMDESMTGSELMRTATEDTLAASREKLRLYGLTPAQIAPIEDGSYVSDSLTIYAPIGGVVTHQSVREGDYVKIGDPIVTVANLSRLWLDLEAYESEISLLRWGQPVTIRVEAYPGESFEGSISFIEPTVDERTRTVAVRVAVDNTDGRLKPGMFASAIVRQRVAANGAVVNDELAGRWVSPMHPTMVYDEPGKCEVCGMDRVTAESLGVVGDPSSAVKPLVIPRTAVLFTGTRSVVYVATESDEGTLYEGREVELGARAGEFYIIRSGLEEGESVVVEGAFRIDSAMQISAKPSMMTPGGGGGGNAHAGHGNMASNRPASGASDSVVPETFTRSLEPVYKSYLQAQEALANDDLGGFITASDALKNALGSVEEVGLGSEHIGAWRTASAELRFERPATTIDDARTQLERMSKGVIALLRHFERNEGETLSLAHCPMAFDNKGADWVQRGTQVSNPYFGSMMLRCGDVREEFTALNPGAEPGNDHGGHSDD